MSAYIQLAVAIFFNVSGQLLMKRAAMIGGELTSASRAAKPFLSLWFMLGVISLGLGSVLWVWVLRKVPLTVAHPITGIVFILVPITSHFLWKEPLPATRILGILVITAGVLLVAKDGM
ncbi:MAG: EamA family transporter [Polyangiaceae bacterium]|nr:EamA family transporter [Polyangiaceae bacterium]NUQ79682.1 EamA family transporter [Polyangiaceae bacterium]